MDDLLNDLDTQRVGRTAHTYDSVGSTNDVARQLADAGTPTGTLVLANEQTSGRGRLGRRWVAPAGTSLLLSLVFYPHLQPHQAQRLTMACSLATAEAIENTAGLPAALKWPNDVLVHGHKVAGILTETSITGNRLDHAIVGIGINVNFDRAILDEIAPQSSTLAAEAGHEVSRQRLLHNLLRWVEAWVPAIYRPVRLQTAWSGRLSTVGQQVAVVTHHPPAVHGLAESVDENGALLVRDAAGRLHRFMAGDVTLQAG